MTWLGGDGPGADRRDAGRFDERAAGYDRDNRFFDEDWAELRDSGYLNVAIPETIDFDDPQRWG